MRQRKYTVAEIDEMRAIVRELIAGPILHWQFCGYGSAAGWRDGTYKESERAAQIEDRIRAYMTNGTTIEELREAKATQDALSEERFLAAKASWEEEAAKGGYAHYAHPAANG